MISWNNIEVIDKDEVWFDTSIPTRNSLYNYDEVEVEDLTDEEYLDMYTRTNSDEGISFFKTEHFKAAEDRLKKEKGKSKVSNT